MLNDSVNLLHALDGASKVVNSQSQLVGRAAL